MKRRTFTLLEVMIAFVLIAIASGIVSLKMHGAIEKKKFHSDIDRLKARMCVAQKLAMAGQADWSGILKREGRGWVFSIHCEEVSGKQLIPLHIAKMDIVLNGKKVQDQLHFDFFASGHTAPEGVISFTRDSYQSKWNGFDLFQRNEGKKGGATHPNDYTPRGI